MWRFWMSIVLLSSCLNAAPTQTKIVDLVYPHLDTANSRWFFFSSACRPFGMVNLSPDTQMGGAWGSGYRYHTDTIKGFSHIHAWQMAGVSVLPLQLRDKQERISISAFSHENEIVQPGYHKVHLTDSDITAELTSTTRVGFHRYQFHHDAERGIQFQLNGQLGPSEMANGWMELHGDNELSGYVDNLPTRRRSRPLRVYFVAQTDQSIEALEAPVDSLGAWIVHLGSAAKTVQMKVALSYTSIDGARNNLQSELPDWNFERVKTESQQEWENLLGRINIEGGSDTMQRRFYTDLWHALQGRRIINDVDGKYIDNTGPAPIVRQVPLKEDGSPQFQHYNSDSFWGAQWTLNTLWHLVYPEISESFCRSLLQYYEDGGLVPRGPSGGNYTYVMTGASSTPFLVSAWMKGIRGFDGEQAYQALKKNHLLGGIMGKAGYEHQTDLGGGLSYYLEKGWVPYPIPEGNFGYHQDGPSLTMEYAYQDWTLAQLAKELGKQADYETFMARSHSYQNVYDPSSGWMRPKDVEGNWKEPFDPYQQPRSGFNESNAAQHTWFVPHDLPGLAELMGGPEAAVEKLNQQFIEAAKQGFTAGTSHEAEAHPEYRRIPINYGNQPSIQTAFVFSHLGRPDLTQYWSRKVAQAVYGGLTPEVGYNGDEDQGLMGSLAVLMKMGLFQMTGGTEQNPVYELGSPWFDRVTIELHPDYYPGGTFVIETQHNGPDRPYIQQATFNGNALSGSRLRHDELVKGGKLVLEMGEAP